MRWVRAAVIVVVLAVVTGCGTSQPEATTGAAAAEASAASSTSAPGVPDVEVLDVATGTPRRLAEFLPGDKPVLLWFWAPH